MTRLPFADFLRPSDVNVAWGARAILRGDSIDIVPDRHGFIGSTVERESLRELISGEGIETLRAVVRLNCEWGVIKPDSEERSGFRFVDELRDRDVQFEFTTNASHGYLYIAAWEV